MRGKDDLRFVAQRVLDGRKGLADAGVVENGAFGGQRNVEVDADKDALVGEIEIADGKLRHGMRILDADE